MSDHGSQIKSYLGISAIISLYGIASLIVLYAGPMFGIGLTYQIVIIALLLLTWPIALIINHFRKGKDESAALPEPAPGGSAISPQGGTAPARVFDELVRGTEEVVQWLKGSKLGAAKGVEPIYSLPWFVVAGPPAQGKTSLLLSSRLDFHALPSQRHSELGLIRPTRDCEWRVTNTAVYLDTAGRYQTEGPDSNEWSSLIETLKKYRKARPLDGFVVAVSLPRILAASDPEIEQLSKTLRARLDEVILRTQVRFPVYLVFTHADALPGFGEFFAPYGEGERAQVWGATIPLEQAPNAHALFDIELDYLYDALMRCRLERLSLPAPPPEQLAVFDFPIRFAEARRKLGQFASALFRPNPFSEKPLLRGFYFTSSGANKIPGVQPDAAPTTAGNGFFSEVFFKDVLFRDRDIAASFQAAKENPHRLRTIGLAVATTLTFLLSAALLISFFNNRDLVARARHAGVDVEKNVQIYANKDFTKRSLQETQVEFQALDNLRDILVRLEDYEKNSPPLTYRFGLYSGNAVLPYLRTIYFDAIHQRFLKPSFEALEADLQRFAAGERSLKPTITGGGLSAAISTNSSTNQATSVNEDLGIYYDRLKTYLMLSDYRKKNEAAFLVGQLADYWKKNAPVELEKSALEHLSFYATIAGLETAPHYQANEKLIGESQQRLISYPPSNRFYKRTIGEIGARIQPLSVDSILEGRTTGSLKGSYLVQGSFTLVGYKEFEKAIPEAAAKIKEEDWVMGSVRGETQDQNISDEELKKKLWSFYFSDYAQEWRKFLHGLNVQEPRTKQDSIDTLRELAANNSPMKRVMEEVSRQTKLSQAKSEGWWGWITGLFSSQANSNTNVSEVEKDFDPLYKFTNSEGSKESPAISAYLTILTTMRDGLGDPSKSVLTQKEGENLQKAEQQIGNLLATFTTAATSEAGRVLRQPLSRIREMGNVGELDQITQIWRNQLYPLAVRLQDGYPFSASGEVAITELAGFLNPQDGKFSQFFKEKLATSFEDVNGQYTLKESGAFRLTPEFIKYLNEVRQLQEALFPNGSKEANFSGTLSIDPAAGDAVIEIGNDRVSQTTPSVKFNWPPKTGASGARISFTQGGDKAWTGDWGLFKMFQEGSGGNSSPQGDGQFQLIWRVGAGSIKAKLNTGDKNPFRILNLCRQMKVPERIRE
ncbi:MAG: type VI secretion system membrane subunit TssM [Acidobacteriota bacterium]